MAAAANFPPPSVNLTMLRRDVERVSAALCVLNRLSSCASPAAEPASSLERTGSGFAFHTRSLPKPHGSFAADFLGNFIHGLGRVDVNTCRSWLVQWLQRDPTANTDPSHMAALWIALTIAEGMLGACPRPDLVHQPYQVAQNLTYGLVPSVFGGGFEDAKVRALLSNSVIFSDGDEPTEPNGRMFWYRIEELSGSVESLQCDDRLANPVWLHAPLYDRRTLLLVADGAIESEPLLRHVIDTWTSQWKQYVYWKDEEHGLQVYRSTEEAVTSVFHDIRLLEDFAELARGPVPKLVGTYEVDMVVNYDWTSLLIHVLFVPRSWTRPDPRTKDTYKRFLLSSLRRDDRYLFPQALQVSHESTYTQLVIEQFCIPEVVYIICRYLFPRA